MTAEEKKYLERIFKRLESVTKQFTKEDGVDVVQYPKRFKGFTVSPSRSLTRILRERYPQAKGQIIFFLEDDFISYVI